jgi:hypothetical protein
MVESRYEVRRRPSRVGRHCRNVFRRQTYAAFCRSLHGNRMIREVILTSSRFIDLRRGSQGSTSDKRPSTESPGLPARVDDTKLLLLFSSVMELHTFP